MTTLKKADRLLDKWRSAVKADLQCPGPPEEQDRLHEIAAQLEEQMLAAYREDSDHE